MRSTLVRVIGTVALPVALALSSCVHSVTPVVPDPQMQEREQEDQGEQGEQGGRADPAVEAAVDEPEPIERLFHGTTPSMPPRLTELGLAFGMTRAAAAAAIPEVGKDEDDFDLNTFTLPSFGDVLVRLRFTGDEYGPDADRTLWQVEIELPTDHALALGRGRWGEPREIDIWKRSYWWFAPEQGMRASIYAGAPTTKLEIAPYVPMLEQIGEGRDLAFDHGLIGATLEQIAGAYPQQDLTPFIGEFERLRAARPDRKARFTLGPLLQFPPIEFSGTTTYINVTVDAKGEVVQYQVVFDLTSMTSDAAGSEALDELFERKWGEAEEQEDDGDLFLRFPSMPGIERYYDGNCELVVRAP